MSPNMPDDPFEGSHGPMPLTRKMEGPASVWDTMFVSCWCGEEGCPWIIELLAADVPVMYD